VCIIITKRELRRRTRNIHRRRPLARFSMCLCMSVLRRACGADKSHGEQHNKHVSAHECTWVQHINACRRVSWKVQVYQSGLFSSRFGQKFGFELSRILTNLKSAVRSLVKACVCQNCKGQQPHPVQSHSFLAVKITCSMIYIWNMIFIRPGKFLVLRLNLSHISWTAKDLYNAALALHLKILHFLLNYDGMVPFWPLFIPKIIY